MDSGQAREILKLYRPGDNDAENPLMAEALEQARRDPELGAWFAQHRAVCAAIRSRLKGIPVPPGLKRKILVERVEHSRVIPLPGVLKMLAAAAAIVLVTFVGWNKFKQRPETPTFAAYRQRMALSVQRGGAYMSITTTNQADLRAYFQTNGAPAEYALSKSLEQLPGEGGAVQPWYNEKVDMLCLNGGPAGQTNDLWVFIARARGVPGAPAAGTAAQYEQVGQLLTASWTVGDLNYLLAARGTREDLQKYLP